MQTEKNLGDRAWASIARAERAAKKGDYRQMALSLAAARELARDLVSAHAREQALSQCDRIARG